MHNSNHRIQQCGMTLAILAALLFPAPARSADVPTTLPSEVYLFCSFKGNGDGLHFSWSADGLKWSALAGDRAFIKPEVGKEKLMRDPCIMQGPDGTFHLVWTTGWYVQDIGYASSKDLIHWSAQKDIPVMTHEPTARNSWAPELVYDSAKQQYLIFWASTIPGRYPETDANGDNGLNHRIYCTTTKDFETFTPTKLFFDPGFSVIDATMLHANDKFYLIFKDETLNPVKKHLQIATSDNIEGPFANVSPTFTPDWVEGPSVMKMADDYIVYFDMYRAHKYGAMRSKDLKTWEDITSQLSFPPDTRHGTAFKVSRDILMGMMSAQPAAGAAQSLPAALQNALP